jgi:hypothetical protein
VERKTIKNIRCNRGKDKRRKDVEERSVKSTHTKKVCAGMKVEEEDSCSVK